MFSLIFTHYFFNRSFALNMLLVSVLFGASSLSFAQNSSGSTQPPALIEKVYPFGVVGMGLKDEQSQAASREKGAVAQHILHDDKVEAYGLDKKALTQELNDTVATAGAYFKTKPDYQGVLITTLIYHPGYKKPFQYPIAQTNTAQEATYFKNLNALLANNSPCNKEGFCSALVAVSVEYINPRKPSQSLDQREFNDFSQKHSTTQSTHVYHTNKNADKPVVIVLYQGTNGYLTSPEFVRQHVNPTDNAGK